MARANTNHSIKLSAMFTDPYVARAFRAAEDDGLAPALVETDHPRTLDGGAAEQMTETTGRRILAPVEA